MKHSLCIFYRFLVISWDWVNHIYCDLLRINFLFTLNKICNLYKSLYITVSLTSIQTIEFHILSWYQSTNIGDPAQTSSVVINNQPIKIANMGDINHPNLKSTYSTHSPYTIQTHPTLFSYPSLSKDIIMVNRAVRCELLWVLKTN